MDDKGKELQLLAKGFRQLLESLDKETFQFTELSLAVAYFPVGCCEDASILLAGYLKTEGFEDVELVTGYDGGNHQEFLSHVWLVVDGYIIDITADQFNASGYQLESVIVSKHSEFHSTFKRLNIRPALTSDRATGRKEGFSMAYQAIIDTHQQLILK